MLGAAASTPQRSNGYSLRCGDLVDVFDEGQQARAIELIQSMPWGDIDGAIRIIDEALLRAMQATADDFQRWEVHADDMGYVDEFSLTPDDVARMSNEWKLAYVARLLRSLAGMFGVGTEFGDQVLVAEHDPHSPAGLLRGLNDIASMPLIEEP